MYTKTWLNFKACLVNSWQWLCPHPPGHRWLTSDPVQLLGVNRQTRGLESGSQEGHMNVLVTILLYALMQCICRQDLYPELICSTLANACVRLHNFDQHQCVSQAPKHQTFLKIQSELICISHNCFERQKSVLSIIVVLPAHTFLQVPPQTWWTNCAPGPLKDKKTMYNPKQWWNVKQKKLFYPCLPCLVSLYVFIMEAVAVVWSTIQFSGFDQLRD